MSSWNPKEPKPRIRPKLKRVLKALPPIENKLLSDVFRDLMALLDNETMAVNDHLKETEKGSLPHSVLIHLHNSNVAMFRTLALIDWMFHLSTSPSHLSRRIKDTMVLAEEDHKVIAKHKDKWEFIDQKVEEAQEREARGKRVRAYG